MLGGSNSTGFVARFTIRLTSRALLNGAYTAYQIELSDRIIQLRHNQKNTFKKIAEKLISEGYRSPRGLNLGPESVFSIYKKRKIRDARLNSTIKERLQEIEIVDLKTGECVLY